MDAISLLRRRRTRRSFNRQATRNRLNGSIIAAGGTLTLLLSALTLIGALAYASITAGLPSLELLPDMFNPVTGSLMQPSRIYDRSGTHILMVLAPNDEPRTYIPYNPQLPNHIPDTLVRATVALLDPDFWTQPGIRFESLSNPDEHPGLTQLLVSQLLLWDEPSNWRRAFREQILAAQLSSHFGREQILEWYLNSANYGHYAYGAEAAARLYLGKPAAELNLAEAALLASISQSPAINPLDAPEAARQRSQEALGVIEARGMATAAEVEQARKVRIIFQAAPPPQVNQFPTFTALALAQLDSHFNRLRLEHGGMKVLTTMDYALEMRTRCILLIQLTRLNNPGGASLQSCDGAENLPALPPATTDQAAQTASAAVMDPDNGQILALAGDPGSNNGEAASLSPHKPGSLLSPFIYLTGFTRGLSPASLLWDLPSKSSDPSILLNEHKGPMRLRTAMTSENIEITNQIFNQMGAGLVQQTMTPFGLDVPAASSKEFLDPDKYISIVQVAQTYGVFATLGTMYGQNTPDGLKPSELLAVQDLNGQSLADWSASSSAQVLSPQLAYLLTDVLSANFSDLTYPAALKTARTQDGAENWAAGYTPRRVVVVWMGNEKAGTSSLAQPATKGLWISIMQSATRNLPPDDWNQPPGMVHLKVCDPSGMLPTDACPNVVDEIFIEGYQPMQADTLYRKYAVNRETNLLATVYTPQQLIEKRVYMILPPEAEAWGQAMNLHVPPPQFAFTPPTQYDNIQPPVSDPNANISSPAMFAELQGNVTITGTAAGLDFSYYRLQYGQGLNPDTWTQIGGDVSTLAGNGALAEWNTTGLKGLYSLQLLVVHKDHSLITATVQVSIK